MIDDKKYYTYQGIMTDPGKYVYLYKNIPANIGEICEIVQGVLIHIFHYKKYGVNLNTKRKKEVQLRKVQDMLKILVELDDRPIKTRRDANKRVVGNCRDFAVLTCSLLRQKKIPARVRCGFAAYFVNGFYEDHWICEYWNKNQNKWIMIDPQIDNIINKGLAKSIDPLNLSEYDFYPAGILWSLVESGKINPDDCGLFNNPKLRGKWFIKDNVFRDFLALNKTELLPWDSSDFMKKTHGKDELMLYNKIVKLTSRNTIISGDIKALYDSNPILQMPDNLNP